MVLLAVWNQSSLGKARTSFLDSEALDMGPQHQTNSLKLGGLSFKDLEVNGGLVCPKTWPLCSISEW